MADDSTANGFRKAMRRLTSAVSVISTAHSDARYGLNATSVTSVSMSPPSLLFCVNRSASLHDPLIRSGRFCINILQAHQIEIADAFGRTMTNEERFAIGDWTEIDGIPYLPSAQANIFCELDAMSSYGTHSIMIGKVRDVDVRGQVAPLLYQDCRYTVGLGEGIDWVVPIA